MSLRVSSLLLTAPLAFGALNASGCATPQASTPSPVTVVSAPPDAEVIVLRERVARLEKRLADVDGKLATLLLRAENGSAPTASRGTSDIVTGPRYAAVELGRSRADEIPLDDGLKSIDLGSRGGQHDEPVVDDIPLESSSSSDDDDDNSGGSVVLRMRGDDSGGVEMVASGTRPSRSSAASSSSMLSSNDPLSALSSAKDLYAWGQARVKERRYLEAIAAFEDVLGRFGKDGLADNSQYWVGFCHQARGDHALAIAAWQKLPQRFPRSDKIPDALFGMAQSHEATGEPALAEVLYDEIVASYPKAEKLGDAQRALKRLRP